MTEAGYARLQTDDPEVHAGRAYASPNGARLEDISTQSWGSDLGLRFFTSHRPVLSLALCVFPHRTAIVESDPCRCDALSHRRMDRTTTARVDSLWTHAEVSHARL